MWTEPIEGKLVRLRIAEDKDAEFTLKIRQDKKNTAHMPALKVPMEQQIEWLQRQRKSSDCFFFVIERLDGERIGTFSVYNIEDKTAETGRLIMQGTQIESIETFVLFHDYVYFVLGISNLYSEIEADNYPAIGLAKRLGAVEEKHYMNPKSGKEEIRMTGTSESYSAEREKLVRLIERFSNREGQK